MSQAINIGDTVSITALLLENETPVDANTLRLVITDPAASQTEYILGNDPELVHDAVGAYHFNLFITQLGLWTFEWFSNASLTAFKSGTILTGQTFTLETVDETPAPVASVDVVVLDSTMNKCLEFQTDAVGEADVFLTPGAYTFVAEKFDHRFLTKSMTLLAPGAGPAKDVTLVGALLDNTWLTIKDLERCVAVEVIDRLFQDLNTGVRDYALLQAIIREAEALAESKLLRSWSRDQIVNLAFHDAAIRVNAAWIAIELATERRGEFIASDGKGRYWVQYERAIAFFDALSKSKDQSRGEKAKQVLGVPGAGVSKNTGGKRKPTETPNRHWVFSDEGDGTKHGGF